MHRTEFTRVGWVGSFALALAASCATTKMPAPAKASAPQTTTPKSAESPAKTEPVKVAAPEKKSDDPFVELLRSMGVRYFADRQTIEIDGWVNMQKGLVEVFACSPQGKTHEAVVVLDCVPSGLQAGLIALGLNPGHPVEVGTNGEYHAPTGPKVEIEVRWKDRDGVEKTAHAEDWVWNVKEEKPMPRAAWVFAGSFMQDNPAETEKQTFAADYVKSLVTTYHDASSILETPLAEGADDTLYYSNEHAVPPVGTPLTVSFHPAH
jgi:hypothetical protein